MGIKLQQVVIDEKEQIFIDGRLLDNVKSYRLEHSADENEPAKLTVTMYVSVGKVCCEANKYVNAFKVRRDKKN